MSLREFQFAIPEPTPLLNELLRQHHRGRKRHLQKTALLVRQAAGVPPRVPFEYCTIHVDRYSAGTPDWDGLYAGLKNLLDSLVVPSKRNPAGLSFIRDDSPRHVRALTAMPHASTRKDARTVITIRELDTEAHA